MELEKDCYSIDIWLLGETHRLLPWIMLNFSVSFSNMPIFNPESPHANQNTKMSVDAISCEDPGQTWGEVQYVQSLHTDLPSVYLLPV